MLTNTHIECLSSEDIEAVRLALEYWNARWDWESRTLFGIDRLEFDRVFHQWPTIAKGDAEIAALAVTGSLRELLLGASAPSQSAAQKIIGIPHNRAMLLMEQLGQS